MAWIRIHFFSEQIQDSDPHQNKINPMHCFQGRSIIFEAMRKKNKFDLCLSHKNENKTGVYIFQNYPLEVKK